MKKIKTLTILLVLLLMIISLFALVSCNLLNDENSNNKVIIKKDTIADEYEEYDYVKDSKGGYIINGLKNNNATKLYLPNEAVKIGDSAFAENEKIVLVKIPKTIVEIGENAFKGCDNLESFEYEGTIAEWNSIKKGTNWDENVVNYVVICQDGNLDIEGNIIDETQKPDNGDKPNSGCECIDEDNNHACDICEKILNECLDENSDNYCDVCGKDILVYRLLSDDTYEVIDYNGVLSKINIPSTYENKAVTSIGDYAFASCYSLTSVTIPDSVISIGWKAFAYCYLLTSVTIGSSVKEIGWDAFERCFKLVEVYDLSPFIEIEEDYNALGDVGYYALDVYTSLDSPSKLSTDNNGYIIYTDEEEKILVGYTGSENELTLPSDIMRIHSGAFYNCDSLISVIIPDTVESIGLSAFEDCDALTSITIPNAVEVIEINTFYSCDTLTSVVIGESIKSIADGVGVVYNFGAFERCYRLIEVYNLSSLEITAGSEENGCIGAYALGVYTSLNTPSKLSIDSDGYMIFTDGEEKILAGYEGSETELTLPSDITAIRQYAFCKSDGILTSINDITSVVIPSSVEHIGEDAFYGCFNLAEVYNLSALNITAGSEENGYVGYYALAIYTSLDTPSKVSTDSNGYIIYTDEEEKILVGYAGSETELTLPSGITAINYGAFMGCYLLTSVTLPNTLISIGDYSFAVCAYLEEIVIPDSVTSIGECAFSECVSLESVYIGKGVTSIGEGAFWGCSKLANITIGNLRGCVIVEDAAFFGCDSLESVNISSIESWCSIVFIDGGSPLADGAKLYLNGELVTDVVIPDSIPEIFPYLFSGCDTLTSIVLPDSVISIWYYAFVGCDNLTSVYYEGTEEEWSGISIRDGNGYLTDATRYYYSETEPVEEGNYWHYVDGVPTPW